MVRVADDLGEEYLYPAGATRGIFVDKTGKRDCFDCSVISKNILSYAL